MGSGTLFSEGLRFDKSRSGMLVLLHRGREGVSLGVSLVHDVKEGQSERRTNGDEKRDIILITQRKVGIHHVGLRHAEA